MKTNHEVSYHIEKIDLKTHYLTIAVRFNAPESDHCDLRMAAWLPGAYRVSDFAKNIESFAAFNQENRELDWCKTDKQTWRIFSQPGDRITVRYQAYSFRLEDDSSYVCEDFSIINPGYSLPAVMPYYDRVCLLKINMPDQWKRISTGMERPDESKAVFRAENYEALVDFPMLLGNHLHREFYVQGILHEVAIEGSGNIDVDQFVADLEKITAVEIEMMRHVPYDRYVFQLLITNKDAGLEHRNSTLIFVKRFDFKPRKKYLEAITIFSHELFHAWNVKALKPRPYVHMQYSREVYTDLLWFSEGFTNYYQDIFLLRAEICTLEEFTRKMARTVKRYLSIPGRLYQSASESSWDAWIKYYQHDPNTNNSAVSYYLKGSLIALLLDIKLLSETNGKHNLDDLMRKLYQEKYVLHGDIGFTYADFKEAANALAGKDLSEFFLQTIEKAGELPFDEYFSRVGLKLTTEEKSDGNHDEEDSGAYIGCRLNERNGRLEVYSVERDGPGQLSGLSAGDEIIAMDGFRLGGKTDLEERLATKSPGTRTVLLISRNGEIKETEVLLGQKPPAEYKLIPDEEADDQKKELFRQWLNHSWDELKSKLKISVELTA